MVANLELHVATSAARYPQATNYLSISEHKSRGKTRRAEHRSGKRYAEFSATKYNKNKAREKLGLIQIALWKGRGKNPFPFHTPMLQLSPWEWTMQFRSFPLSGASCPHSQDRISYTHALSFMWIIRFARCIIWDRLLKPGSAVSYLQTAVQALMIRHHKRTAMLRVVIVSKLSVLLRHWSNVILINVCALRYCKRSISMCQQYGYVVLVRNCLHPVHRQLYYEHYTVTCFH